jgi:hypothetical protein
MQIILNSIGIRDRKGIQNIRNQTKRLQSGTNREQARTDVYSTTHSDSRHQRVCELIYDVDIFMSPNQSQCILVGVRQSRPISSSRNVVIFKKCISMALFARVVTMLYIHRQAQRSLKDTGHPCCLDPFA